jgi:mono/diheme cytochrome c family protein
MGFLPTDKDLKRTISNGISGTAMPMFRGTLNDENLEAVIVYLKSFSREWKKAERHAEPVVLPGSPEWMKDPDRSREHSESGKALFAVHCAACHGIEGKGDGPGAASLKDLWQFEIQPADLSAEHYKSGDRAEDLFRTISLGLDGTPMVGFMGVIDDIGRWDLVTYIRSLQNGSN